MLIKNIKNISVLKKMRIESFSFNLKNREFNFKVKICNSFFSQCRGLMFRKNSMPLLFIFKNKKRRAIHSFFCVPFIAFWFNDNKIIEVRKVFPWRFFIKPKKKFDKLLEIPINSEDYSKFLDGGGRKV